MAESTDAIAFIAETSPENRDSGDPVFRGHIEGRSPARLIEDGPGWDAVDAAIAWARDRAPIVLVRMGVPGTYYSAGVHDPPDETLPRWPSRSSEGRS